MMHENSQNSKLISLFPAQKKETSGNFVVSFGGWDLLRRRLFRGPSEQLSVRKKIKNAILGLHLMAQSCILILIKAVWGGN